MGKTFKANDEYSRNKKNKFKARRQKKRKVFTERYVVADEPRDSKEQNNAYIHRH